MSVEAHAVRLSLLMDVMGVSSAALVGHGMGAAIVALVARNQPERVCKLALINPEMRHSATSGGTSDGRLIRLALLVRLWRRLAPQWLASALHGALVRSYHLRGEGARSLDVYMKAFRTRDGRATACTQLLALRDYAKTSTQARGKSGPRIGCDVLLAAGDFDPLISAAEAERLSAELCGPDRVARCSVELIPGAAHYAPEEAPDRLGALLVQLVTNRDQP